ncbi:hypothetical protein [Dyella sp.]|uniref:hypothetical protein n=1 Tax=Dyella sp. TaxID=1869338 RepID=UPI003F7F4C75
MDGSDTIATLALIVSIGSAVVSYKAFKHSVNAHELETTLAFEKDKSELLMHVEQSRNLFSSAQREIENVRFVLAHEPPQVQRALASYDNLFTEFLPKLVGAERQATSLWNEVYEWRDKSGRSAFAHHTPKYRALLENDRVAHQSALKCVAELRNQITRAHEAYERGQLG